MLRYNTEIEQFEGYNTTWGSLGKNFTLSNFDSNTTITNNIISKVSQLIDDKPNYDTIAVGNDVYGDGFASRRIVEILRSMK